MIFAIDFDGTCVTHDYPNVGRDIGAEPVLKELVEHGHKLILWTMRSGKELADAVKWFDDRNIPLFGVNHNPEQESWTSSPKVYAHKYIDDAGVGVPLCLMNLHGERPYVSWNVMRLMLTPYLKSENKGSD